jgi:ornithine carbamoyltransferase
MEEAMSSTGNQPQSAAPFAAVDLVHDGQLSIDDTRTVLVCAARIRKNPDDYRSSLSGRTLVLLFEKPSLRTRVTFEVAMQNLGGNSLFMDLRGEQLGQREPIKDVARNLDRWVHAISARVFKHSTVEQLAHWARIPVINALCDLVHPCQALADVLTIHDVFGKVEGVRVAYVGDGNNVAHSLMLTGAKLGMHISVATPPGYEPNAKIVEQAKNFATQTGGSIATGHDPEGAVSGSQVVYTDVWTSMGSEHEAEQRRKLFIPFQVNEKLFSLASPQAVFLHCLPAHRGEEVTDEVIESPRSVVFDQAENRMHAQRALLWLLLAEN